MKAWQPWQTMSISNAKTSLQSVAILSWSSWCFIGHFLGHFCVLVECCRLEGELPWLDLPQESAAQSCMWSRFDDVWWCDRCDLRQGIGKWRVLCRVTAALALAGWIWIVDQWQKPCFNRSIGRKKEKRSNTVKSRNDCHILRGTRITKVARKLSKTVIDFFIRGVSWGLPDGRNALSCTFQTWSQRRCSFCRNTRVRWRLLCLPSALFALSALSWRSFLEAMHWVRAGHNKSAKIDFRDLYGSLQTFIFINSMFHGRGRQIMATPSAEYFARKSLR